MRSLLASPGVIADLKDLHAGLAVAIPDFTPERAQLVHRLNQVGIPVIGWLMLPKEQGFYFNVDCSPGCSSLRSLRRVDARPGSALGRSWSRHRAQLR